MGMVIEPTGFSHSLASVQSSVVAAARRARTGEGTLNPSDDVIVPIVSRALTNGTLGPMAYAFPPNPFSISQPFYPPQHTAQARDGGLQERVIELRRYPLIGPW